MELYDCKENCYGCTACHAMCPTSAIKLEPDEEGFFYPIVTADLCIGCNKCKNVCPNKLIDDMLYQENPKIYAVKHKNEEIRYKSTSGGIFTSISDVILSNGGCVYGAAFDNMLKVIHKRAATNEERDEMSGSKYVQSDLSGIFQSIYKDLAEGRKVLFTGTPCQVSGLKGFLGDRNTDSLILCDIICHGVPSPLLWKDYIRYVEDKKKARLKTHYFRTKLNGWHSMTSKNVFMNERTDNQSLLSQLHMKLFLSDLMLRPCCYHCRFASMKRYSDLTIGDFWGIESSMPDFDDNKGISLVLIHTEKGNKLLAEAKDKLEIRETEKSCCMQHNLRKPTLQPKQREDFWRAYQANGYEYAVKKYAGYTLRNRVSHSVYQYIKKR